MAQRNRNRVRKPASRPTRFLGAALLATPLSRIASGILLARAAFANHINAAALSAAVTMSRQSSGAMASAAAPAPQTLSTQFKGNLPITELSEDEAIMHALNRLELRPAPGRSGAHQADGPHDKWIDQQLHPEKIDDSALQARFQNFPAIGMSAQALLTDYPQPAAAAKRMGITGG